MRKVGVPDHVSGLIEDCAGGEARQLQARLKALEVVRLKGGEEPVRAVIPRDREVRCLVRRTSFTRILWDFLQPFGGLPMPSGHRAHYFYPRPTNGILVAITVMNRTLASSGRLAM